MGIGGGRTVVLRLANEERMGRDSGLVIAKAPGASFGVPGRVRLAWVAHRSPSSLCVRAGQGITLLLFLRRRGGHLGGPEPAGVESSISRGS